MKKLFRPACLLFYLLMLLSFFFLGLFYAGWIEAGKGQMLAGGAIVLGYGVLFGGIAFIASFFIAYYAKQRFIVIANIILTIFIIATIVIFRSKYQKRKAERSKEEYNRPTTPSAPAEKNERVLAYALLDKTSTMPANKKVGIGFFQPKFYEKSVLHFYGNPNLKKSVSDHTPFDSIVFRRLEQGGFEITQAPPWLVPEHMKLDYDMLYFKIKSLGREFAEVIVNAQTQRTTYVNKYDGKVVSWPDFLLSAHSIEFPSDSHQRVKARPFENASDLKVPFSFLRPVLIQEEWMQVELWDENFESVGKGWVRWKKEGELLITYSLLS